MPLPLRCFAASGPSGQRWSLSTDGWDKDPLMNHATTWAAMCICINGINSMTKYRQNVSVYDKLQTQCRLESS